MAVVVIMMACALNHDWKLHKAIVVNWSGDHSRWLSSAKHKDWDINGRI